MSKTFCKGITEVLTSWTNPELHILVSWLEWIELESSQRSEYGFLSSPNHMLPIKPVLTMASMRIRKGIYVVWSIGTLPSFLPSLGPFNFLYASLYCISIYAISRRVSFATWKWHVSSHWHLLDLGWQRGRKALKALSRGLFLKQWQWEFTFHPSLQHLFVSPVCLQVKISCNTSARHLIFCFHHLAILKGQKQKHECSRKHKRIIDMKLHEIALMKKFQNFRIVVYRRFYAMRKKNRDKLQQTFHEANQKLALYTPVTLKGLCPVFTWVSGLTNRFLTFDPTSFRSQPACTKVKVASTLAKSFSK